MPNTRLHSGDIVSAIQSLEDYFREGGVSIIQAAFAHSYFVHPDEVRMKTPYFPNRARKSLKHYPGCRKGELAKWPDDGREVRLDDNRYAQEAWSKYSGRPIVRGSGYGLRHIWGHPWDPNSFTAGWNFCYMPFWAGMLTEKQHPLPELEKAICQASWDLYFRENQVCTPPAFVEDPGMDLDLMLGGQSLLILTRISQENSTQPKHPPSDSPVTSGDVVARVKAIRAKANQSWSNIHKAVRALQGKDHDPFGTPNVAANAKSIVRKIKREVGLTPARLEVFLDQHRF